PKSNARGIQGRPGYTLSQRGPCKRIRQQLQPATASRFSGGKLQGCAGKFAGSDGDDGFCHVFTGTQPGKRLPSDCCKGQGCGYCAGRRAGIGRGRRLVCSGPLPAWYCAICKVAECTVDRLPLTAPPF